MKLEYMNIQKSGYKMKKHIFLSTVLCFIFFLLVIYQARANDTPTGHTLPIKGTAPHVYDGTNYKDIRSVGTADGGDGTGVLACGMTGYDGANYQTVLTDSSGNVLVKIVGGSAAIGTVNSKITNAPGAATVNSGSTSQSTDFDLVTAASNLRLIGISIRESAGTAAAATVIIRVGNVSGGNCTGNPIGFFELNGDQSIQIPDYGGGRGLSVAAGVCADVVSGTVDANAFSIVEANP